MQFEPSHLMSGWDSVMPIAPPAVVESFFPQPEKVSDRVSTVSNAIDLIKVLIESPVVFWLNVFELKFKEGVCLSRYILGKFTQFSGFVKFFAVSLFF